MPRNHTLYVGHGLALVLALAAALGWPRAGEPALLLPLAGPGIAPALAWADAEGADYLAIDPGGPLVIVRVPSDGSLWRALGAGIVPVAARAAGCTAIREGRTGQWKS